MARRSFREKLKQYWKKIDPGIIIGVSDDDPLGIATYSQAGAVLALNYYGQRC